MVDMWVQLYHSLTLMEEQYSKPKINKRFIHSYILHEITNSYRNKNDKLNNIRFFGSTYYDLIKNKMR